jgi:hypothetical protein
MDLRTVTGLLAVLSPLLPAQNVTTSLAALTPVTYSTGAGTSTVGAGPLPAFGSLSAPGAGSGSVFWSAGASTTEAEFVLGFAGSGAATIGPSQLLVTIASTGPLSVPLRYEATFEQQSGSGYLQFGIDVGNNGSVDWQYGQTPMFAATAPDVAVQPLQLRFLVDFQHGSSVSPDFSVRFRLRAVRDGIYAFPLATNCGVFNDYSVASLFDTSVADLMIRSQYVCWHVIGLAPAPTLLPPALTLTTQPCLLVPSPDLVLRTGTLYLPVPQALRPIVLHTQLVDFSPAGGLRVSDAYQVALL